MGKVQELQKRLSRLETEVEKAQEAVKRTTETLKKKKQEKQMVQGELFAQLLVNQSMSADEMVEYFEAENATIQQPTMNTIESEEN